MKPENFPPNIESLVGEIGNEINKAKVVENKIRSKRSLQIDPWVFISHTLVIIIILII